MALRRNIQLVRDGAAFMDVLYITYDGLLEPIGRSQILPYLLSLADQDVRLEILSFEKAPDLRDRVRVREAQNLLSDHGIRWSRKRYHRYPTLLSTALDILVGTWVVMQRIRTSKPRVVHARSYVPAIMAVIAKWVGGARFVFDTRGFWPEERVDLGIFREGGLLFRVAKGAEALLLRHADQIVVLTHRAKEILQKRLSSQTHPGPIEVIPCCVDPRRFSPREPSAVLSERYGLRGKLIVGNLGAVSPRYQLLEMFRFATHMKVRLPKLHFVYITRQDPGPVHRAAQSVGWKREDLLTVEASPDQVPEWLSLFQLAIFFLKPSYAAQASCYTKLGEFLGSGVPVVTNAGVGDVEQIIQENGVGVILEDFSDRSLSSAVENATQLIPVSPKLRSACLRTARTHFSLQEGCSRYLSIYQRLLEEEAINPLAWSAQ
jgi:glycosyltransferase involved in cell wall biosynthesis